MKWLLVVVIALVALAAMVFLIGMLLPVGHVARVRADIAQRPERVYQALSDVAAAPGWRSGLERVDILSGPEEPLKWRETGSFGPITFVQEESQPPKRRVVRIADVSQGFGGRWIYELAASRTGTTLTITEEGEVYNPIFRFMSRFIFGQYRTLEQYARDLGKSFGEDVSPARVRD